MQKDKIFDKFQSVSRIHHIAIGFGRLFCVPEIEDGPEKNSFSQHGGNQSSSDSDFGDDFKKRILGMVSTGLRTLQNLHRERRNVCWKLIKKVFLSVKLEF